MVILCITLWFILQVSCVVSNHDLREGVLLFMEAGSLISFSDLWNDTNFSDTANLSRYKNSKSEFLQDGTHFRSPLIDRLDELDVQWIEMIILNADGGYMTSYTFEGIKDKNFVNSSVNYLVSDFNEDIDSNYPNGPFVNIHNATQYESFSFMSVHMKSGLAGLFGEQFIVSTNDTFGDLASAEYDGCYTISSAMDYIVVTSVYECTLYCLTVADCEHTGIYTVQLTSQSPITVEIRCMAFTALTKPQMTSALCGYSTCPDGNLCGQITFLPIPVDISISVYSVAFQLGEELQDMKPNSNDLSSTITTKMISINYTINFEDPIFIHGFRVLGGFGPFQVATWIETCEEVLTDLTSREDIDRYLTDAGGEIMTFDGSNYINPISPTKFRCMYFNSSTSFYDLDVTFHLVTHEFQLAQYVAVLGAWRNVECNLTDIMTRSDIIRDSSIHVDADTMDFDFSNDSTITTPLEYKLLIDLHPIIPLNTSILSIFIKSSEDVSMTMTIFMAGVNGYETRNATISGSISFHKENFLSGINAENITIQLSALSTTPYLTIKTFDIGLKVIGCISIRDALCSEYDMIGDMDVMLVTVRRAVRKSLAYNVLKTSGTGLSIIGSSRITINIPFHLAIEITRVFISGDFASAVVELDGVRKNGRLDTATGTIDYRFDRVVGYYLYIENITSLAGANYVFPKITVKILACEIPYMPSSQLVTSPIYSTSSQSVLPSKSFMSESTLGAETLSSLGVSTATFSSTTIESSLTMTLVSSQTITSVVSSSGPTIPTTTPIITTMATSEIVTTTQTTASQSTNIVPSSPSAMFSSSVFTKASGVLTTNHTTSKTSSTTDENTTIQPTQTCLCGNVTYIKTPEELEESVKQIQKKLTVPPKTTAAFKRTKISAPDNRTSSKVIGTAGVASMTMVGVMVVAMDAGHIINAYNFIKALLPL